MQHTDSYQKIIDVRGEAQDVLSGMIDSCADEIRTAWENGEYSRPELITDYLDSEPFVAITDKLIAALSARPSLVAALLSSDDAKEFEHAIASRIAEIAEADVKEQRS